MGRRGRTSRGDGRASTRRSTETESLDLATGSARPPTRPAGRGRIDKDYPLVVASISRPGPHPSCKTCDTDTYRPSAPQPEYHPVDLRDPAAIDAVFAKYADAESGGIYAVIHLAALKAVGESGEIPIDYYKVNVGGSLSLLEVCRIFCPGIVRKGRQVLAIIQWRGRLGVGTFRLEYDLSDQANLGQVQCRRKWQRMQRQQQIRHSKAHPP